MGGDKMGVMLFRRTDGLVPKEHLHLADIGSSGQKLHRERIAESVRVGVNIGKSTEALYRASHVFDACNQITVACPEEVLGADGRQGCERGYRVGMKQDLESYPCFQHPQDKVGALQRGPAQLRHIRYAKSAIQEHQHQGARSFLDVRRFGGVVTSNLVASGKQPAHFVRCEWQGGQVVNARHAEAAGGVIGDPSVFEAPSEKRAKCFQFLPPCGCHNLTRGAVCVQEISIHRGERRGAIQVSKGFGVTADSRIAEVPPLTGGEESGDGFPETASRLARSEVRERVAASFDGLHQSFNLRANGRVEGAAHDAPADFAVCPNRALAQGEGLPLRPVRAGFQVATVGLEHGCILTPAVRHVQGVYKNKR